MKKTRRMIQFRTKPETQKKEDNRSRAGKIASALGGAAVIGGAGYMIAKKFKAKEAAHIASRAEQTAAREVKQAKKIFRVSEKAVDTGKATPMSAKPYVPTSSPKTGGKYSDGGFNYGVKPAAPAAKPVAKAPLPSLARPGETHISSFAADRRNKIAIAARKAATKAAPEQTVKIVANRKPAPSAPSAPIGAKNIAASNAVEAAHVAKKAKAKTVKVKTQGELGLSALHQKMINFQERRSDNRFGTEINPLSAYRKASRVVPWVNRASEAAGDIGDIASGKKVKDPFYKKSWFKRAAQTAAIGVGVAGLHLRNRSIERHNDGRLTNGTADKVGAWIAKKTGGIKQMSAKPNKLIVALKAHARLVAFATVDPLEKGWDLRDARGRSARVYAPGSKKRDRREKEWGEKTDNIRAVRNAAIVTAAGLGGLAIHQGIKLRKANAPKVASPGAISSADFRKMHTKTA